MSLISGTDVNFGHTQGRKRLEFSPISGRLPGVERNGTLNRVHKNENIKEGRCPRPRSTSSESQRTAQCLCWSGLMICRQRFRGSARRGSTGWPNWDMNCAAPRRISCGTASTSFGRVTRECITGCSIFFVGKAVVVLSHGLTKEREVPSREIDLAVDRKKKVETNFEQFTFRPE